MERARLQAGSLLKLRTGRGVWHAEGIGEDELREGKAGSEMRGVLFWVNLARKDKGVAPSAQLLNREDVPVRQEGDAIVRVLVGEGSPVELGTPGLILDVELPKGGAFTSPVPSDFNGFVYMLEGEASLGANRRRASRSQIAVLGPGRTLTVADAQPGTRFMLMAGKPYGETPGLQRTVCGLMASTSTVSSPGTLEHTAERSGLRRMSRDPDGWWFHLRRCAGCGHIGCCDSSPSQHARHHAADVGHPIVQSYEPGEDWFFDYIDERFSSRPGVGAAASSPARPARAGTSRSCATRLAATPALTPI